MGRKQSTHKNLPKGMRARIRPSGTYYYYDAGGTPRREIPLGDDYVDAVRKWAELEGRPVPASPTFRDVAEKYLAVVLPTKAPRTQKDNLGEIKKLYEFFDNPPARLDQIAPHHIAQYRDWRKITRSTQELALFSHIWNWAREQGYTQASNPTIGVKRNRSKGRDVFVDDALFIKVYDAADQPTRDAMDLIYLIGQRPNDMLNLKETDIKDGALWLRQGKTGTPLRIEIVGDFAELLDRIKVRKAMAPNKSPHLIVNEKGERLTYLALDARFGKAREAAGVSPHDFQLRDLRAKAATEVEEASGMETASNLLGHTSTKMTGHYVRNRIGKLVKPVK